MKNSIREVVNLCLELKCCDTDISYGEPMSAHTTFKTGGKADCYVKPYRDGFTAFSASLFKKANEKNIPVFVLGGGANIVVSDKGIRGIVLDTSGCEGAEADDNRLIIRSGTAMNDASEYAASLGLTGLEFLAGMPGTIGGGVYMNARCYGSEIADVLEWTEILNYKDQQIIRINTNKEDFGYKRSPYQKMECLILSACFNLQQGDKNDIYVKMEKYRKDREDKGHYRFPCAGSVFKNNREFGKPTGQIIDELGLRGYSIGGAQIAPFHGNIIINTGNASSSDIRALTEETAQKVKAATGFCLEPEIIFV